jgi:signal transduction histidine kinase/ActR/RegA family two-component response regulator
VVGSTIPFVPESEKEKTAAGIQKVLEGQPVTGFETKRLTKDGRTLDIVLSSSCYDDHRGHRAGIVVFLRDVTRTKETERKFQKAQKMEAIGTLAGGVAHDFNNLLTGIQGRASLLSFEMEPTHPLIEHVDAIMDHAKSAADLTKQLLGIAREGKYEAKPISLNEVVQQSAIMFGRTKKEIRIHYKFQDPSPVAIADLRQIEQVLLNLYINAWQAMPEGGDLYLETSAIELGDTYCQSYAACGGRFAKIAVTDTGVGMDSATCERVFDPFFTTKKKSRGTGLGLASAYGIIKNHNGIITVESQMGVGTTFNVYLPFSHQPVPKEMSVDAELRKGSGTILLVDDEKLVLDVSKAILEKLGYHVLVADNGVQAIQTVRQGAQKLDLVILDMIMPGLAGGKTFESIREIGPEIPVLLSSGYSRNRQVEEIIRKGANGFIQKPFQVAELSQIVRTVIADVRQANS